MAAVRHISIENFRTIRHADWYPRPGINCLIGPGDTGKSTFLDAIDLVMGARRSFSFSDADFHLMNSSVPITIIVTLGQLDESILSLENYGRYLRGFDKQSNEIHDEPQENDELVITLKLV